MCLDVLRAARRERSAVGAMTHDVAAKIGPGGDRTGRVLEAALALSLEDEGSARLLTEQLALSVAAAELRATLPTEIADAFCETRLGRPWRHTWGMLDARYDSRAILDYCFG